MVCMAGGIFIALQDNALKDNALMLQLAEICFGLASLRCSSIVLVWLISNFTTPSAG